jgi:hypothetical protein
MDKEDIIDIILRDFQPNKTREEVRPFVEQFLSWTPEEVLEDMDEWDAAEAINECAW